MKPQACKGLSKADQLKHDLLKSKKTLNKIRGILQFVIHSKFCTFESILSLLFMFKVKHNRIIADPLTGFVEIPKDRQDVGIQAHQGSARVQSLRRTPLEQQISGGLALDVSPMPESSESSRLQTLSESCEFYQYIFKDIRDILEFIHYNYPKCLFNMFRSIQKDPEKETRAQLLRRYGRCRFYHFSMKSSLILSKIDFRKYKSEIEQIIMIYITSYPRSIQILENYGHPPLHEAIKVKGLDNEIVMFMLNNYPDSSCIIDHLSTTPLCNALRNRFSNEVINFLLQIHPSAATIAYKSNIYYPIHIAIEGSYSKEIILAILNKYTDVSTSANIKIGLRYFNRSILHLALENNVHKDVLYAIIQKYPDSVIMLDRLFNTPLHLAIEKKYSSDVIIKILKLCENICSKINKNHDLPLHIALNSKDISSDNIIALIRAYPQSVSIKNKLGEYPHDIAIKNKSISPVIIKLLPDFGSLF